MSGEAFPTVPILSADGQVSHAWQRFLQAQWRKTGQATDDAPINSLNITGILSSLNLNTNGQLNATNFCTVDSIDNGVDATIRVYGTGGPGTTWTRQVSNVTFGPYPAMQQAGISYATDEYVMFNPKTPLFVVTPNFVDTLPDGYIWCGKVTTVAAGGGGGTTGGGGSDGSHGGNCFTGETEVITDRGNLSFHDAEEYENVLTYYGYLRARKTVRHYRGPMVPLKRGAATPEHPFRLNEEWIQAQERFPDASMFQFDGNVYCWQVETDKEEERNFILASGETVHNLSII